MSPLFHPVVGAYRYDLDPAPLLAGLVALAAGAVVLGWLARSRGPSWWSVAPPIWGLLGAAPSAVLLYGVDVDQRFSGVARRAAARLPVEEVFGPLMVADAAVGGLTGFLAGMVVWRARDERGLRRPLSMVAALGVLVGGLQGPMQVRDLWAIGSAPTLKASNEDPVHVGRERTVTPRVVGAGLQTGWTRQAARWRPTAPGPHRLTMTMSHPVLAVTGPVAVHAVGDRGRADLPLAVGTRWDLVDRTHDLRVRVEVVQADPGDGLSRVGLRRMTGALPDGLLRNPRGAPEGVVEVYGADGEWIVAGGGPLLTHSNLPPDDAGLVPCASVMLADFSCYCRPPGSGDAGPVRCTQPGMRRSDALSDRVLEAIAAPIMPSAGYDRITFELTRVSPEDP